MKSPSRQVPLSRSDSAISSVRHRSSSRKRPRPVLRELGLARDVVQRLTIIVIGLVLVNLVTMRYRVEGPSMQSQLEDGQVLVLNRIAYKISVPARGDIVVFHLDRVDSNDIIKRVIGLPGETVEIRYQKIWINGRALEEQWGDDCQACEPGLWTLGQHEYFLLGDHRAVSRDSRTFGPIPDTALMGKVIWRYWPLDQFGPL